MKEKNFFIDNLKINCLIGGQGPSFLILHGWGSKAERWQEVGGLLVQRGYRVIVPDLPGFGKSEKPNFAWGLDDYANFVDNLAVSLELERFYLLGHSFGGALAVKYGLKFPKKVDKLFLVGAACLRKKSLKKKIFWLLTKPLKIFSFLPGFNFFKKGFYRFLVRKSDYPYAKGIMKDIYLRIIKEDLSDVLPRVEIPTLIIWGEKDDLVPLKDAHLIKERIPNSYLAVIPQGDHHLEQKLPKELTKEIVGFLN